MDIQRMRNKKGQFYLFTAIILVGVAIVLLRPVSVVPEASDTFKKVHKNFVIESRKLINTALLEEADVAVEYDSFVNAFLLFAKTRRLDFEVFYVLVLEDEIIVKNRLTTGAELLDFGKVLAPGEETSFKRSVTPQSELNVRLESIDLNSNIYKFNMIDKDNQLKLLTRVIKEGDNELFIEQ